MIHVVLPVAHVLCTYLLYVTNNLDCQQTLGDPTSNQIGVELQSKSKIDMVRLLQTESMNMLQTITTTKYFDGTTTDRTLIKDRTLINITKIVQHFQNLGVTKSVFAKLNLVWFMKHEIDKSIPVMIVANTECREDEKWVNFMGFNCWFPRNYQFDRRTMLVSKDFIDRYKNQKEDGVFIVQTSIVKSIYDSVNQDITKQKEKEKKEKEKKEKEKKEKEKKEKEQKEKDQKEKEQKEKEDRRTQKLPAMIPHSIKAGSTISLCLVNTTATQFCNYVLTVPTSNGVQRLPREFEIPFIIDHGFNLSPDPIYRRIFINKKPVLNDAETFLFNGMLYCLPAFSTYFSWLDDYSNVIEVKAPADYRGLVTKWPVLKLEKTGPESKILRIPLPTVTEWKDKSKDLKKLFVTDAMKEAHAHWEAITRKRPRDMTHLKSLEDEWNKEKSNGITKENIDRLLSLQKKYRVHTEMANASVINLSDSDDDVRMHIEDVD